MGEIIQMRKKVSQFLVLNFDFRSKRGWKAKSSKGIPTPTAA